VIRYAALLIALLVLAGCGTKTVTKTVRLTETRTTTVVKRIAAPPDAVFVPDRQGDLVYKPEVVDLSDTVAITDIHWTRYGKRLALGHGRFLLPGCVPTCATGKVFRVRMAIHVKDPVRCHGRLAYRLMGLDGPGFTFAFEPVSTVINATRQAC
jgi:hypothetical protein